MDVEILYANLERTRVPIENAHQLKRTGVLFIILSEPQDPRTKRDRFASVWGEDHYGLYCTDRYCGLWAWGQKEMTYRLKLRGAPFENAKRLKKPPGCLAPQGTIYFLGRGVDLVTWTKALDIFHKEMF